MPLICISSVVQCLVFNIYDAGVTIINPHDAQTDHGNGISNGLALQAVLCT